ncbi:hypothetical protein [Brevibacterium spongiae]|uniref:Uncharacterized protein n=1 Tax=Brevibacterium spongiae TaxID=2909672 RepID=A0ABY5SJC7_9MICO|nr:hypothetical protein [Brevibacterium spongiae]UVI34375.1 hypothetical protein L1F31_09455 [Brevibacterium spongiae]
MSNIDKLLQPLGSTLADRQHPEAIDDDKIGSQQPIQVPRHHIIGLIGTDQRT